MQRFGLRDDQWERIKDFLPGRTGHVGGTAANNRLFVDAVLYRYRTGIPWRDLPTRFGDWKIVHQRFGRWAKSGVFERIFKLLASDPDNEYMMIDATIVRAHQHSAGARKKRPAGDRQIARRTDHENPRPHRCLGQSCRVDAHARASPLLIGAEPLIEHAEPEALIGDKGYDADPFIAVLTRRGITPVIPPKANRKIQRTCDFALYCERNLVERFFNQLKHFRAIATRYDKLARNFLAGVQLAAAMILLN